MGEEAFFLHVLGVTAGGIAEFWVEDAGIESDVEAPQVAFLDPLGLLRRDLRVLGDLAVLFEDPDAVAVEPRGILEDFLLKSY